MSDKITTAEMEVALANYLNYRINLIVPNISHGIHLHECDLLVLTPSNYAWEVEIKVSKTDLIKDKLKRHLHRSHKIRYLYFAIPEYLVDNIDLIPERAGIIIVKRTPEKRCGKLVKTDLICIKHRKPKINSNYQFSAVDRYKMARLGAMRIWKLKSKIIEYKLKSGIATQK